jgi:hypothetical protein
MDDVVEIVVENDKRLSVHEAICASRYENIQASFSDGSKRMTKIEYLLYAVIAAVLLGPGVAAEFIKKFFGL